ncbi:hypothetical protein M3Y14_15830 [Bacillus thuringiensis]|uniref:hypothetical protein n=1 Tax=Bacillus thuringiensis TaxID=1428 RepID=UPI0022245AD8|nr:hypothetical protein [Bacillus thuringiensis]UYX50055.1 hypothetical protein M3Y14_15830 [Bacillus thuringiensis]
MRTFNVTFTQTKVYEAVVEAETMEKAVNKVRDCQAQEEDLVEKDIAINDMREVPVKEQKFEGVDR